MKKRKKLNKLTIYLKTRKKPFCEIEYKNQNVIDNFYKIMSSSKPGDIIKFGVVIFNRDDFDYAIYTKEN